MHNNRQQKERDEDSVQKIEKKHSKLKRKIFFMGLAGAVLISLSSHHFIKELGAKSGLALFEGAFLVVLTMSMLKISDNFQKKELLRINDKRAKETVIVAKEVEIENVVSPKEETTMGISSPSAIRLSNRNLQNQGVEK